MQEDVGMRIVVWDQTKTQDPIQKMIKAKRGWGHGSRYKIPVWQVFKPHHCQKNNKKTP
jgi:hypothetical protein